MSGFASKLITALFKRASARLTKPQKRAALALEPLEMRAVLATAAPIGNSLPSAPVVDLQLDPTLTIFAAKTTDAGVARKLTTGANVEPAGASAHGGGGGAGKVQMQDFHFNIFGAASRHSGGANFAFGDGHVHFAKDSVPTRDVRAPGDNTHEPPGELPVIAIDSPADDERRQSSQTSKTFTIPILNDTASEVTGPHVPGSAAQAAARWQQVIIGDLPNATFDSEFRYVPIRRPLSALGDGSVRTVGYSVSPPTWNAGPFAVADDVIVDGRIITGENWNSAHGSGGGTGKVAMQDLHFNPSAGVASRHTGGANFALADGSVRFVSNSVSTSVWATDAANDRTPQAPTGTGGGGAGRGTLHFHLLPSSAAADPIEVLVGAGAGAPGGHVKVFDGRTGAVIHSFLAYGNFAGGDSRGGPIIYTGHFNGHVKIVDATRLAQPVSFLAFGGFHGGVNVASAQPFPGFLSSINLAGGDVNNHADQSANGHGTHVAGTIGSDPSGTVHTGAALHLKPLIAGDSAAGSTKTIVAVIDTGIDYSHPDLYQNIWINQSLERLIGDLASDVASRQHGSRH